MDVGGAIDKGAADLAKMVGVGSSRVVFFGLALGVAALVLMVAVKAGKRG